MVAFIQRRVGESLLEKLPDVSADLSVDLGCGTGFFLENLHKKLKGDVVAFDLAEGMTRYVKRHNESRLCVCGDAENIPLADASVDCIYSSLAIQWCEDNRSLFSEIYRVLKPGGKIVFSTLGPETLAELKQAWSAVDDYVHVNRFVGRDDLQRAAVAGGFSNMEISEEMITLEYAQLKGLTRELKGIGAHNVNEGRPAGLTGRHRIKQLLAAYEGQRNERGMLPATYQVWYGVLQK
jgi:malonyl-CoA O-methyltransferase